MNDKRVQLNISRSEKRVCISGLSVARAGDLGFRFAKKYRDLIDEGWCFLFFDAVNSHRCPDPEVYIPAEPEDIARLIRDDKCSACGRAY